MKASNDFRIFVWSDRYRTGEPTIDSQHHRLIDLINELGAERMQSAEAYRLRAVLNEVVDYARYHFSTEEALMREHQFEGAIEVAHLRAHDDFHVAVDRCVKLFETNPGEATSSLLTFLVRWLAIHILKQDMKLAAHIRAHAAGKNAAIPDDVPASDANSRTESVFIDTLTELYEQLSQRSWALTELTHELQQTQSQQQLILEMNDNFHAARTNEEAFGAMSSSLEALFRPLSGALALFNESEKPMRVVANWGYEPSSMPVLRAPQCAAVECGRTIGRDSHEPICSRLCAPPRNGYVCLPLRLDAGATAVLHVGADSKGSVVLTPNDIKKATHVSRTVRSMLSNILLRERLEQQAVHDSLTGLFNRRYLDETLQREVIRSIRKKSTLCLAMIDLDHFKEVNDRYGHQAGDEVLRGVGKILKASVRGSDLACRFGGEEFVLLLPDSTPSDAVRRLAQLQAQIEQLVIRVGSTDLTKQHLSIGLAASPDHAATSVALIAAADMALYRAKREGRNRIVVADAATSIGTDTTA